MAKTKVIIVANKEIHDFFTQQYADEWDTQRPVETIDDMWNGLNDGSLSTETEIVLFLDVYMNGFIDELSTAIATFASEALVMVIYYDPSNHPTLAGYVNAKVQGAKFFPIDATGDLGSQIHDSTVAYSQMRLSDSASTQQAVIEEELSLGVEETYEEPVQEKFSNQSRGLIIASTSSKGGSGKTTVALCTASMLYHASRIATEKGLRDRPLNVCIIDMDTRDGQIGFLLGQYAPTALNLFVDNDRTPEGMLKHLIKDDRLGIHVLLAPKRARTAEYLTPEFYQDVIQKLSTMFDVVILDTSVHYLDPLLGSVVLPISDAIMFVTNLSIGSVYGMNRWMDEVTTPLEEGGSGIDRSKIGVVVNQSAPDLGIDQNLLEHAAGGAHLLVAIPLDSAAVISASNHNRLNDIVLHHQYISPAYYKIITQIMPDEAFVSPTEADEPVLLKQSKKRR
jgi:Flp pilus assembly CpaE family ATPase